MITGELLFVAGVGRPQQLNVEYSKMLTFATRLSLVIEHSQYFIEYIELKTKTTPRDHFKD